MAKLRKESAGTYTIVADDGKIIGAVLKFRGIWWAKPAGECLPTYSASTLAEIRQAIKEI